MIKKPKYLTMWNPDLLIGCYQRINSKKFLIEIEEKYQYLFPENLGIYNICFVYGMFDSTHSNILNISYIHIYFLFIFYLYQMARLI
jgi:hypothetical protein